LTLIHQLEMMAQVGLPARGAAELRHAGRRPDPSGENRGQRYFGGNMTIIHAIGKRPNHTYRLYGEWGERRIPEARCKADLYALLRSELGLPAIAGRSDVVGVLLRRSWDAERQEWLGDREAAHGPKA